MTDETAAPEVASTDPADNHVAPPQIPLEQARAIAAANEASGFPTPPAVQAVIDADEEPKPSRRSQNRPAAAPAAPPAGDE